MDLLITQGSWSGKLSDLGFYNLTISDQAPASEIEQRTVRGRNGYLHDGVRFSQKVITVTGRICLKNQLTFQSKIDEVNGLLVTDRPFYITKMYPDKEELYDFQLPGQETGELDIVSRDHTPWHYRFLVLTREPPVFEFLGRSSRGLLFNVSVQFVTSGLPFGQTIPSKRELSDGMILYKGTASLSQLEWPLTVELVSSATQSDFYLEINGRRWEYRTQTPLKSGDRLEITGLETRVNGVNATAKTNYAYFILEPSRTETITYQTDFQGTISLVNFVELYK